jgi:D-alanine-D-alanine ligase
MDDGLDGARVAVCCGGDSAEAEVSLVTGNMVADALRQAGAAVTVVGPDAELVGLLLASAVDVVFPALHGPLGEDGCLQGLLEFHRIPYVGSGVCASACANDKIISKRLFRDAGLPVARDVVLLAAQRDREDLVSRVVAAVGEDVVVKPARQGSGIGVGFAKGTAEIAAALETAFGYGGDVLVEERVEGAELTAGVLDLGEPRALPVIEIRTPPGTWYDYEHRYTAGLSEHVIPAPLPGDVYQRVQEAALAAHILLGCRHLSRADFVAGGGRIALLEVNTMPGMTPTSLYPDAAREAGYPFGALVTAFVRDALGRATLPPGPAAARTGPATVNPARSPA